jgi:hypothetical protein
VIYQVIGYWLNQMLKFWASRPEFLEFFSLQNPIPLRKAHVTICRNDYHNFVANFLKFSNQSSDSRLSVTELTSILWREKCSQISAFSSSGARTKANVGMI